MKNIFAYIRVSTKEQNTDRQHEALEQYAVSNNIEYKVTFEDRASGKDFERKQYKVLTRKGKKYMVEL
ncbi:recombinase family protein [Clostridium estertheticum]|uniref:recombinase family protein n=1 Tax=Clostridium estertheticum TaxID=238834 RepID=UPI0013EE7B9C|nr:recombinase family protein [Clostridium estertheticum]MBZ9607182.1 recombinase family protein [Clostridium estertheticum]